MKGLVLALVLTAAPVAAEERLLTAEDFEKAVTGRTFFYTWEDQSFGAEQYLPGRKVVWAFTGDDCQKGEWFADGENICFVYEGDGVPHCWTFWQGSEGLVALSRGSGGAGVLVTRQSSPEPMRCLGPDVGA